MCQLSLVAPDGLWRSCSRTLLRTVITGERALFDGWLEIKISGLKASSFILTGFKIRVCSTSLADGNMPW